MASSTRLNHRARSTTNDPAARQSVGRGQLRLVRWKSAPGGRSPLLQPVPVPRSLVRSVSRQSHTASLF